MRLSLALLALAGCVEAGPDEPTVDDPPPIATCTSDAECGAGVCARTGECLPAAQVRKAQVIWTIGGQPPTDESCYWIPNMKVEFWTEPEPQTHPSEIWESGPLPCTLGTFTIDKLPVRFWIGGAESPSAGMWVPLDDTAVARINLP